jgi:photosystem II stability/assembly factor-like uncharacterized protein
MKKLLLLLWLVYVFTNVQAQTWTLIPNDQILPFTGCAFTYESTGYMTSTYLIGEFMVPYAVKTTDGGNTFDIMTLPAVQSFVNSQKIKFQSPTKGFIVGGGIALTTDAGNIWNLAVDMFTAQGVLYDIAFCGDMNGAAVGTSWYNDPIMFQTGDGGYNWSLIAVTSESTTLNTVVLPGTDLIYIGATGTGVSKTFVKSIDNGMNWSQPDFTSNIYSLCFTSETVGFAGSDNGIFMTDDAGDSWTSVLTSGSTVNSIMIKNNFGFAVCENGSIYNTVDNGYTWTIMTSPVQGSEILYDVSVVSNYSAYASGSNGTVIQFTAPVIDVQAADDNGLRLRVFPNPAVSEIMVDLPMGTSFISKIMITDLSGSLVREIPIKGSKSEQNRIRIEIDGLKPGMYIVSVESNNTEIKPVLFGKI